MLTKKDFHHNFRLISLGCKLAVLPFEVDLQRGELQPPQQNKRKRAACSLFVFSLYTLHTTYVVLRLPYLFLKGMDIPPLSFLWHFTLILGLLANLFWNFMAFIRWPGITVTCFKLSFETFGVCERSGN